MKRKFLFGLIFLLCCGLLNARSLPLASESCEPMTDAEYTTALYSNLEAYIPPDSLPWTNDFEQCYGNNIANGGTTRLCGYNESYAPLKLTASIDAIYNSVRAMPAPTNSVAMDQGYIMARSGKTYFAITPSSAAKDPVTRLEYWPAWVFTPVFELREGKTYTFSFWYMGNASNEMRNDGIAIKVMGGEVADVNGNEGKPSDGLMDVFFDSIVPFDTRYKQCKVSYTPKKDFLKFAFALHVKSATGTALVSQMIRVSLDDFEVAELQGCPEPKEPIGKAGIGSIALKWNKPSASVTAYAIDYKRSEVEGAEFQTRQIPTNDTTFLLTGLDEAKEYTIAIRSICGTDTSVSSPELPIYANAAPFPASSFPFVENFESAASSSKWIFVHEGQRQFWIIGDSVSPIKSGQARKSLYSTSTVTTVQRKTPLSYVGSCNGEQTVIYAYRDITFPEGAAFSLKFYYQGTALGTSSGIGAVYLVDTSYTPRVGRKITNYNYGKQYTVSRPSWTAENISLSGAGYSGQTKRLIFAWTTIAVYATGVTPLAVDSIYIDGSCPSLDSLGYTGLSDGAINIAWESANGTAFKVQYRAAGGSWTSTDPVIIDSKSYTLPYSKYSTQYDVRVQNYCSSTDQSAWREILNIHTPQQTPLAVPFAESFDSTLHGNDWAVVNGSSTNLWCRDSLGTGNYTAYISNSTPLHRYGNHSGKDAAVHLYRDITFPATDKNFLLSFDWTAWGIMYNDYLKVSLVDIDDYANMPIYQKIPTAGTLGIYCLRDTLAPMANAKFVLTPSDYAGKTKRLMFTWINDNDANGQNDKLFSATIDNIRVDTLSCSPPQNITLTKLTKDSINLAWTTSATSITLQYRAYDAAQGANDNWKTATCTNRYELGNLASNRLYEFLLQMNSCGKSYDTAFTVRTLQELVSLSPDPFYEDFSLPGSESDWTTIYPPFPSVNDRWIRGTKANLSTDATDDYQMYISLKNEDSNTYVRHNNTTYYYLYREFTIPANTQECEISFDWKGMGNNWPVGSKNHNLSVYVTDLNTPLLPYSAPQGYKLGNKNFSSSNKWTKETFFAPIEQGAKAKRLVFAWKVDSTGVFKNSAAAIDNISIRALTSKTPTDLTVGTLSEKSLTVQWESDADSNFTIAYKSDKMLIWEEQNIRINVSTSPKSDILVLLNSNTLYQVKVKINELGSNAYTLPVSARTFQEVGAIRFEERFDDPAGSAQWTFIQDEQKNQWYKGDFGKERPNDTCLYIDKDGGKGNLYDNTQKSISHVYRDIEFGNDATYSLSYDWKGVGISGSDLLKVSVIATTVLPVAGVSLPSAAIESRYGAYDWTSSTVSLPATVKNTKQRIVFTWENAVLATSNQPPAAIDNILIDKYSCTFPINLKLNGNAHFDSLNVAWETPVVNTGFEVRYRVSGDNNWKESLTPTDKAVVIKELAENTLYEIQVRTVCSTPVGNSAWSSTLKATTNLRPTVLPIIDAFDTPGNPSWVVENGIQPNRWVKGVAANDGASGEAMFISNDGGILYNFNEAMSSVVYFYHDVIFPPAAAQYALSFDWKANGGITQYMKIFLMDTSIAVKSGAFLPNNYFIGKELYYGNRSLFKSDTIYLPDTLAEKTKRLVFAWINASLTGSNANPPAAVDNIKFIPLNCITPVNPTATCTALGEAALSWSAGSNSSFTVYYRKKGAVLWDSVTNRPNPTTLSNLSTNTEYEFQVLNTCGGTDIYRSTLGQFNTLQEPATIPFYEYFQDPAMSAQWSMVNGVNHWTIAASDFIPAPLGRYLYVTSPGTGYNSYGYNAIDNRRYTYAFRDIDFNVTSPEGFKLAFDWISEGVAIAEYNIISPKDIDNLQIFLVDPNLVLDPTKDIPHQYLLSEKRYYGVRDKEQRDSIFIPGDVSNTTKRLVFRWTNTRKISSNFIISLGRSALIDDISITTVDCSTSQLQVVQELLDSVTFKWDASENAELYTLQYAETGATKWEEIPPFKGTSFGVKGLKPTTSYTVRVTPECDNNMPMEVTFTTPLRLTVFEDFGTVIPNLWTQVYGLLSYKKEDPTILYSNNVINNEPSWNNMNKFAYINSNSTAASLNIRDAYCNAWMITPDIYLDSTADIELSFKLVITGISNIVSENPPALDATAGLDDKFGILISDDDHWAINDTLAFWHNMDTARRFQKIANTKLGERITIPIKGRKGRFKIAFYGESTVINANNVIFVDSLLIRRPNVCEPISELKVSNTLPFSAKAAWTGDHYQNNYQIRWELQSNAAEKGNSFTSVPNKQMTNILPSKTYTVTTRGICGANDTSVWAQMVTFETPSNCSDVTNITSIPDSNSAVISWSKNGTNKQGYLYCYDTVGGKTVDQLTPEFTADTNFEATDLTASTSYVVYVRPICTYEDTGSWSSYNFRTRNLACGVPAIPSISGITSTSATANWTAGYRSESYEFRYGSSATISAMSKVPTSNTTSIMSGLQPANTYYCVVRALCAYGDTSAFTEATDFITLQCTTVDSLKVNWNDNQTVATVTWRTKGGQNSWEVYLKSSDNSDNRYVVVNDSTYTINRSSLNASLGYEVEVRTVCGSSYSLYSAAETVKVSISNNELPEGVRISISPNPATDYVKLSIEGVEGNVKVELFSIAGQLINTEMLNCSLETTKELSLSGLAKGAYTIRLTHEKWSKTEKLIVK